MKHLLVLISCFLVSIYIYGQSERLALVIGNSNYQVGAPLPNPENDAADIAALLEEAGFKVALHINLNQSEMKKAIDPDYAFPRSAIFNFNMEQAFANGDYDSWIDFWYKKVDSNGHWRKESINAVMQVFNKKDMNLAYILTDKMLHPQLKDHPRYIELLKNMNLYKYVDTGN